MTSRYEFLLPGLLAGFLLAEPVVAQTQLNLRSQSRNVDFSAAPSTRPVKTGTVLPATCLVGDLFFRTTSLAGKNLHGCTALNVWTIQADITPSVGAANYVASFSNQTSLLFTAGMHGFDSPNILVTCFDAAVPANVLAPSGVTIDSSSLAVTVTFAGARSGRCVLNAPGTAYFSGEGLFQNGGEFSIDTAAVPSYLKGQATLTGWTIVAQTCANQTFSLVGAALLDPVAPSWPADLAPSLSGTMFVSAPETLTIRLCNLSSSDVSVPVRIFGATILKSF